MVIQLSQIVEPKDYIYSVACVVLIVSFRYDVSVMISLLLISIVSLNYLYRLIVVFIVMVKLL